MASNTTEWIILCGKVLQFGVYLNYVSSAEKTGFST